MKLRSVYLENFRSYKKLNIKIKNIKFVILTGKNGTGKTNLLEAISFLSPGKGFKNCRLDEVINTNSNSNHSSILKPDLDEKGAPYMFFLISCTIIPRGERVTNDVLLPTLAGSITLKHSCFSLNSAPGKGCLTKITDLVSVEETVNIDEAVGYGFKMFKGIFKYIIVLIILGVVISIIMALSIESGDPIGLLFAIPFYVIILILNFSLFVGVFYKFWVDVLARARK